MAYSDPRSVCAAWITEDDLCCAEDGSVESCDPEGEPEALTYQWTNEDILLAASNILYARTCYRYPGACEVVVWPCVDCRCRRHPCGCGTFSSLRLPTDYPVLSVEAVEIDGVAVDPSDYRLDQSRYIVRTDGERWPSCNSFGLPDTDASEIRVEATVGRPVPIELKMACADLACELKKACNGAEGCELPPHVRSMIRRGVEIEVESLSDLFKDGRFGIPSVDMALAVHGRCGKHGALFDPLHPGNKGYGVS